MDGYNQAFDETCDLLHYIHDNFFRTADNDVQNTLILGAEKIAEFFLQFQNYS